jgi:hypothetical protein
MKLPDDEGALIRPTRFVSKLREVPKGRWFSYWTGYSGEVNEGRPELSVPSQAPASQVAMAMLLRLYTLFPAYGIH